MTQSCDQVMGRSSKFKKFYMGDQRSCGMRRVRQSIRGSRRRFRNGRFCESINITRPNGQSNLGYIRNRNGDRSAGMFQVFNVASGVNGEVGRDRSRRNRGGYGAACRDRYNTMSHVKVFVLFIYGARRYNFRARSGRCRRRNCVNVSVNCSTMASTLGNRFYHMRQGRRVVRGPTSSTTRSMGNNIFYRYFRFYRVLWGCVGLREVGGPLL